MEKGWSLHLTKFLSAPSVSDVPLFVNKNIATFVWINKTGGFILDWKVCSAHRRSSVRISFDACARLTLCAHVVFLGGGGGVTLVRKLFKSQARMKKFILYEFQSFVTSWNPSLLSENNFLPKSKDHLTVKQTMPKFSRTGRSKARNAEFLKFYSAKPPYPHRFLLPLLHAALTCVMQWWAYLPS